MVTTQLDFLHLRTTAGLARQVRRVANKLIHHNIPADLKKEQLKLEEAIRKGEIDNVMVSFEKILNDEAKEEHYLYLIEKDELILLNEEEKVAFKEKDIEEHLKPFIAQLQDDKLMAEFIEKIDRPLAEICKKIHDRAADIRQTIAFLKEENVGGISRKDFMNRLMSEKNIERGIKYEARYEKKYVKGEKKGVEKLYRLFKEMTDYIKQGKKDRAIVLMQRMVKIEKKVFDEMKAEADYIYDIILKGTYLYLKLLEIIKDILPQKLQQLQEEKFPETERQKLQKELDDWFKELWNHINNIYSLSRYQEIRAR